MLLRLCFGRCILPLIFTCYLPHAVAVDTRALNKELEKLKEAQVTFEQRYDTEVAHLKQQFDRLMEMINRGDFSVDAKVALTDGIASAKSLFEEEQTFAKIAALQPSYAKFVTSIREAHAGLMASYERVFRKLPAGDSRHKLLRDEIREYTRQVEQYDSLKEGVTWVGYRIDRDWGAAIQRKRAPNGSRRYFELVRNDPVQVQFTFRVDKRDGRQFEGTVTQNGGRFVAIVRGSYDGITLTMQMVRMVRGNQRQFAYRGQVVGNLGVLHLYGIKTTGIATTGTILLETKQ